MFKKEDEEKRLNIIVQGIIVGTTMTNLSQEAIITTYVMNKKKSKISKYKKTIFIASFLFVVFLLSIGLFFLF